MKDPTLDVHSVAMLRTVLVAYAVELAAVSIPVGPLLAWGFAGGDGEQPNPLAPLAGLLLFGGCIASLVVTSALLSAPARVAAVLILAGIAVLTVWYLTGHPEDADRRPFYGWLLAAAVATPLVAAGFTTANDPASPQLLITTIPPTAFVVALGLIPDLRPTGAEAWRELGMSFGLLAGVPALLGLAVALG